MPTLEKSDRLAFATFEVDLRSGELWKAGFRIRLPGQPFKVLVALLERPGEIVTRDELQAQIWGSNTNVDFERAVAGAINKIREALGDSADNPRFVETLPRRGYRFIAPVTITPQPRAEKPRAGSQAQDTPPPVLDPHSDSASPPDPPVLPVLLPAPSPLPAPEKASLHPLPRHSRFGQVVSHLPSLHAGLWPWVVGAPLLVAAGWFAARLGRPPRGELLQPPRVTQVTHYVPVSIGPPNVESFLTLAQDGDRILTSVLVDGRSRLSAIIPSTGEVQHITTPDEIASGILADISRDGAKLLLRSNLSSASEQPLWIVPSAGGSGQRVGNVLAHDATWMPDGISILYASENDLFTFKPDDGISIPFGKLPGRAFWLRWSPDGKLLRFTMMDPVTHVTGLWEVNSTGGAARPVPGLHDQQAVTCCGVWTADGNAYVFQANDNLWAFTNTHGKSAPLELTNGPLRYLSPVAARSGSRIYFVGLESPSGLEQFDDKHHDFHAAAPFLADANRIEYSRDGQWVAWTDLNEKLWRARASDGSDKIRLSSDATEVFLAHWSPDGKRLALMARDHGSLWQTYIVDAAGGRPEALLKDTRNTADPSWSADGQKLVFGREPDLMGKERGSHNLQVLDLLTHQTEVVPNSEGMFSPRWSPDGAWICALSLDQKNLLLYNTGERTWKRLAATSAADPVWSSDSQAIYVHAFLAENAPILRISVPDGAVQTIADLSNFRNRETANFFFGGLTPRNEPLVQPRVGTGSIYSLDLARELRP